MARGEPHGLVTQQNDLSDPQQPRCRLCITQSNYSGIGVDHICAIESFTFSPLLIAPCYVHWSIQLDVSDRATEKVSCSIP